MDAVIPASAWVIMKNFIREKRTGEISFYIHKGAIATYEIKERHSVKEEECPDGVSMHSNGNSHGR